MSTKKQVATASHLASCSGLEYTSTKSPPTIDIWSGSVIASAKSEAQASGIRIGRSWSWWERLLHEPRQ